MTNKIKIYQAAPWICKDAAKEARDAFVEKGFEVTSRWLDHHSDNDPANLKEQREQAEEDIVDLLRADIFVILNLEKSEGKACEMGMAYASNMPVILVGEKTRNVFYHL